MSLVETLKSLPPERRIFLGGAVLGVILAMSMLVRGAMEQPMALLYAGLEPARMGEIIQVLDQQGVPYEVRGEAVFTPEKDRDAIRFALAREGLPKQSVQGFELLDDVNGFSVTSEMYNATYWRAKEGELTRTILAIPGVTSARVHIGASLRSGFSRSQPAQTASVTIATSRAFNASQAEAIQYLVALAVSGLDPNEVAVIDPTKGMIAGPGVNSADAPFANSDEQSAALEQKVLRLLEARVGAGNARVSVSMDINRERRRVSEVSYDPASRIVRNRSSSESSENRQGGGGAVTVASNLPQAAGPNGANSDLSNSSETVAYDFSEKRVEMETMPGSVERISVAVVVNEIAMRSDPGTPLGDDAAQLALGDIEQLVRSAAGLSADRGDALTVEFMPFQLPAVEDMIEAPGLAAKLLERYLWSGVQALLLGLVVLVLGLGVIRPMMRSAPSGSVAPGDGSGASEAGEASSDPFDFLKTYAREREDETAALLQDWLDEDRRIAANE